MDPVDSATAGLSKTVCDFVDTPDLNPNVDATHDDRLQHTSKAMNMNTHIHGIQTDTPTKVHLTFHVCQAKGIT